MTSEMTSESSDGFPGELVALRTDGVLAWVAGGLRVWVAEGDAVDVAQRVNEEIERLQAAGGVVTDVRYALAGPIAGRAARHGVCVVYQLRAGSS